jgi:adenosylcobinamide-GDP ribazoletransferase
MTALLGAFQFLTLIPPIIKRPFTDRELGQSVGFYPLVGLILGAILYGVNDRLSLILPDLPRAALILSLWVISTGALHLDGFLDACDGLFGGFTPEKRLEIMRDERIGAFGFAGGFLLLLLKFTAIAALPPRSLPLLSVPVLSRWGMSAALVLFPYGREQGVGRVMKDNTSWIQFLIATGIALLTAWFTAQGMGLIIFGTAALLLYGLVRFTLTRIPGLTGDIYGALNEFLEALLLFGFLITGGSS